MHTQNRTVADDMRTAALALYHDWAKALAPAVGAAAIIVWQSEPLARALGGFSADAYDKFMADAVVLISFAFGGISIAYSIIATQANSFLRKLAGTPVLRRLLSQAVGCLAMNSALVVATLILHVSAYYPMQGVVDGAYWAFSLWSVVAIAWLGVLFAFFRSVPLVIH